MLLRASLVLFLLLVLINCLRRLGCNGSTTLLQVPQIEKDALQSISKTLGKELNFSKTFSNADPCVEWSTTPAQRNYSDNVTCDCTYENNSVCHITKIYFKAQSLQGTLPPELDGLPFLQELDLSRNYLNGSLPPKWASMQLKFISLFANRLSGEIPREWGKMSNLTYLSLESNQLHGRLPEELGDLLNLENLTLSSNSFSGELPTSFSRLTKMKDFRISDNNFSGTIPEFVQNWSQLDKLTMQASGLEGPIPPSFSVLGNLTSLIISDINGTELSFPWLEKMKKMKTLILRNCNISGTIPAYISKLENLNTLDMSFNKLEGELPQNKSSKKLKFLYLSGNFLTGLLPNWASSVSNIDLSYNNFTLKYSQPSSCPFGINLYQSISVRNNSQELLPCSKNFSCSKYILEAKS